MPSKKKGRIWELVPSRVDPPTPRGILGRHKFGTVNIKIRPTYPLFIWNFEKKWKLGIQKFTTLNPTLGLIQSKAYMKSIWRWASHQKFHQLNANMLLHFITFLKYVLRRAHHRANASTKMC